MLVVLKLAVIESEAKQSRKYRTSSGLPRLRIAMTAKVKTTGIPKEPKNYVYQDSEKQYRLLDPLIRYLLSEAV